ncbi:lipopolysaccharide biosynthesis protein [Puniceicoccaceae bacterium K14]|nr:lipopolysaccharide biosynthesis protein [Puniceicoccaceae bacterium K14]
MKNSDSSTTSENSEEPKDQFETKHLNKDLKSRSVKNGAIVISSQGFRFVATTLSGAVLARLLMPEDFGLIAMTASILAFVYLLQDAGLAMATVQKDEVNHEQVSTLFWLNLAITTILAILTIVCSPLIAELYGDPRLKDITIALAIPLLIGGLTSQHSALLTRQLKFKVLQIASLSGLVFGIAVAIISALNGASYWALVYQRIASASLTCALMWIFAKWIPGKPTSGTGALSMLKFGANLSLAQLIATMIRNLDNILLGKFAGSASLGFYSKSYGLLMLPITQMNGPVSKVAIPTLSRLQNDPEKYRNYFCKGISMLVFFGMPLIGTFFVFADTIINIMLGSNWSDSIILFRLLAPAALIGTFNVAASWLFIPTGRTNSMLNASLIAGAITIIGFLIGIQWGAKGIAISVSCTSCISIVPVLMMATHKNHVSLLDIFTSIWHPAFATISTSAAIFYVKYYSPIQSNNVVGIIILGLGYVLTYSLIFVILPGSKTHISNAKNILETLLKRKAGKTA